MTFFKALVAASLVAYAAAECPNACSGHGTCSKFDMCTCYRNWQAADCSQRTCPFDLAHVDTPKGDLNHDNVISDADATATIVGSTVYEVGTNEQFPKMRDTANAVIDNSAHDYMECSNKGICDRTTGTCECFDGYDGSACQRASCPNSCSGHGTCESISLLASREFNNVYALWDKDATMGCNCDAGYGAADCSERHCKHGTDPLYSDDAFPKKYKASYTFSGLNSAGASAAELAGSSTYAITFTDIFGEKYDTAAITMGSECTAVLAAIGGIPNDVVSGLSTTTTCTATNSGDSTGWTSHAIQLDFGGNPGNLQPIVINEYLDGTRKTVTTETATASYTLDEWTRQIGENTDHFSSKCANVAVTPTLSIAGDSSAWADGTADSTAEPGSIGYLAQTEASFKLLAVCLGDSDADTTNNVDVYNWDHGAIQVDHQTDPDVAATTYYTMGSHPHAIKVENAAGDSEYVITWYDATTGRDSTYKMRIANMVALTDTGLSVYTTNGVVQMLGMDNAVASDSDKKFTALRNETKLTGYFSRYSNKIYTNFDGSCETTGDYYTSLHNCVEKGDLLFIVDGCWGSGQVKTNSDYQFGGNTPSCAAPTNVNKGNGMLYTVNKIYTKPNSANTTSLFDAGLAGSKGQEDRFVIEVDHNLIWDGSEIGNPDQSSSADATRPWGFGFTGIVVLFKFTPATDGSSYTYVSECSNRGSCDSETGLCACFKGYTGDDCSTQNSLAV